MKRRRFHGPIPKDEKPKIPTCGIPAAGASAVMLADVPDGPPRRIAIVFDLPLEPTRRALNEEVRRAKREDRSEREIGAAFTFHDRGSLERFAYGLLNLAETTWPNAIKH